MQMYCHQALHNDIQKFAKDRDISKSAAIKLLVERSLNTQNTAPTESLDHIHSSLDALLHCASFTRVLITEIVNNDGLHLDQADVRERVNKLIERYVST